MRRPLAAALGLVSAGFIAASCTNASTGTSPSRPSVHASSTTPRTTPPSPSTTTTTGRPSTTTTATTTAGTTRLTGCRPGNPLANVYHPDRLVVLRSCFEMSGTVVAIRHEDDGDIHVNIAPDPAFAWMLNARNRAAEGGALVVEIVPADEAGCTKGLPPRPAVGTYDYGICTGAAEGPPAMGAHVAVTGPYVLDTTHGWNEIHPAWRIVGVSGSLGGPVPPPTTASALGGGSAGCAGAVSYLDAKSVEGTTATIRGTVVSTLYDRGASGGPTFLDFHDPYRGYFSVVIWAADRGAFPSPPEQLYDGRTICVHGLVSSYNGAPEMVVRSPAQIASG